MPPHSDPPHRPPDAPHKRAPRPPAKPPRSHLKTWVYHVLQAFRTEYPVYWTNMQFFANLMVVLNISFFFLTELVTKAGYFFTYFSLLFFGAVQVGLLLPLGLLNRLWYYLIFLFCAALGSYFFIASVVYWIQTNSI